MAYEIPTAAELQAKYPAFADVASATIDVHVADAAATAVDTAWREADYAPAIMAFAAHRMAGLAIGAHGQAAEYARQGVTNLRSGSFAVSLDADKAKAAAAGALSATPYGQEYKRLLLMNRSGPRVVRAALPACASGLLSRQNNGCVV